MSIIPPDEDIQKIRKRMLEKKGSGAKDPNEFRFPKVSANEKVTIRFRIMPPTESMSGLWFYVNGAHFINSKKLECPRIHENEECPLCALGFDLMQDMDKAKRSEIARNYLSRKYYAVNLYFPPYKDTPEDLRGKVMWCNLSQTLYDKCEECIMADGPGDGDDPHAFGNFFSIKEGYVFQVTIKPKGTGKQTYNDYGESKFLVATKGPLNKDPAKIKEILDKRHDVATKFAKRDIKLLDTEVARILKRDGGGGDEAGFTETVSASSKTEEAPVEVEEPPATSAKPALAKPAPAKPAPAAAKPVPAKPAPAKPAPAKPAEEVPEEVEETPTEAAPTEEVAADAPAEGNAVSDEELKSLLDEIKKTPQS
jgi:hypothetical protein